MCMVFGQSMLNSRRLNTELESAENCRSLVSSFNARSYKVTLASNLTGFVLLQFLLINLNNSHYLFCSLGAWPLFAELSFRYGSLC